MKGVYNAEEPEVVELLGQTGTMAPDWSRPMTFAVKLRELMREKGWSVETTAENAHLQAGAVKSYLLNGQGKRMPTLKSAMALAKAFGVSLAVFEECEDLHISEEKQEKKDKPE